MSLQIYRMANNALGDAETVKALAHAIQQMTSLKELE